ncbi:MAG: TetR/AcrR family transcriptional regulator [Ruminococcus sp.]|nr:TetR/AcrR family transcriptional regulator [Ruminococcus sp.]
MPQKRDKRVRCTVQALQDALITLLQQKPKSHISVRELCELADVNCSTFYVYYKDINELLDDIEEKIYGHIEMIFETESNGFMQMQHTLEYVKANRIAVLVLYQQDGGNAENYFSSIMWEKFDMSYQRSNRCQDIPQARYLYEMLYTGTNGVIRKWLKNGCIESSKEITQII